VNFKLMVAGHAKVTGSCAAWEKCISKADVYWSKDKWQLWVLILCNKTVF
jgi:hypothetical protein